MPALRATLAGVRRRGYAVDRGEMKPDLTCIAAPVTDASGRPVAAISATARTAEVAPEWEEETAAAVLAAAAGLGPPVLRAVSELRATQEHGRNQRGGSAMVQAGDRFSTAPAATRRQYAVSLVTLAAGAGRPWPPRGAPPEGAPRSGGKTGTVQVWTAYPVNAPNIKVLSDMVTPTFKSANPAASVEITSIAAAQFMEKLTAVRSSKDAPDFTWANQFVGTLALYDWIYPMDTYYRQIGVRTDDFYGVVERQYRFNGRWWIYPHYSGIKAYVYRTDFFAEAGLRQFPTTWEEFADASRRLTKRNAAGEITRSGHSQSKAVDWEELLSWGRQNGALEFEEKDPLQGKATVNAPAFVEAFTAFLDLRRRHQVAPVDGNPPGQGVIGDNVAIARQGPWWLPSMRATNPQNADKLAVAPPLKTQAALRLGLRRRLLHVQDPERARPGGGVPQGLPPGRELPRLLRPP